MTHESGYIFLVDADNRIVATGYNGAARGVTECLEVGTCWRKENNVPHGQQYEKCVAVHAEANAIINCDPKYFNGTSTIYIYGCDKDNNICDSSPCLMCDRMIKNAKLNRCYYENTNTVGVKRIVKKYK